MNEVTSITETARIFITSNHDLKFRSPSFIKIGRTNKRLFVCCETYVSRTFVNGRIFGIHLD